MAIKILITGGSGFIGGNLMNYYLKKGCVCLNLDNKPPVREEQYSNWKMVDILNLAELEDAVLNFMPTFVLHMAARTDLEENYDIKGYSVNFDGTENLIETLNKCSSVERVIFASSMLVCKSGYNPVDYNDYCAPNLYGESKVLMEKRIKETCAENYEWVIIRPTSIWGPGFKTPYKDFFDLIIKNRYVKFSGKSSTKTFGFIYNSVQQIDAFLSLEKELVNNKTFYIGDYQPMNINNWADEIAKQLNRRIISIPYFIIKLGSWFGDVLMFMNIKFPLHSFRVKNMTTDNVISLLDDTRKLVPVQDYSVESGISETLKWIKTEGQ
ncbi:NAD-dependent epimerase/dehydratase family protein [Pedobacter panaciterrae]